MQLVLKRRLTKVALALAVAGYCAVPAVAANGNLKAGQWQSATESTGTIQGTIPWITRAADKTAETDKAHVTVTIDRGSRTVATEGDRQFHAGDKVKSTGLSAIRKVTWMRITRRPKRLCSG